jgi:hypothetical protein
MPLSADEDTSFFFGMVKLQPGDISIVDKAGTFLLWYDTFYLSALTLLGSPAYSSPSME